MKNDPIVAEVRENRRQLAEKMDFDLKKIISAAHSRQNTSGHRIVSFAREQRLAS